MAEDAEVGVSMETGVCIPPALLSVGEARVRDERLDVREDGGAVNAASSDTRASCSRASSATAYPALDASSKLTEAERRPALVGEELEPRSTKSGEEDGTGASTLLRCATGRILCVRCFGEVTGRA